MAERPACETCRFWSARHNYPFPQGLCERHEWPRRASRNAWCGAHRPIKLANGPEGAEG